MRGLVGIDVGMLDDDFSGDAFTSFSRSLQYAVTVRAAIQANVDVAVAGDFERGHAFDGSDLGDDFPRDADWRPLELPRQVKRRGDRQLAERGLFRLLQNGRGRKAVAASDKGDGARGNLLFDGMKH